MLSELWKILSSKNRVRQKALKAFSTLEVATAAAFVAVLMAGSYSVFSLALHTVERSRQYTMAEFLAHDMLELTMAKRNEDWSSMVVGTYHFEENPDLEFVAGSETIGMFTRNVQLFVMNRDGGNNLILSGGTPDPDTISALATVTWSYRGENYQFQLQELFTNWRRF